MAGIVSSALPESLGQDHTVPCYKLGVLSSVRNDKQNDRINPVMECPGKAYSLIPLN